MFWFEDDRPIFHYPSTISTFLLRHRKSYMWRSGSCTIFGISQPQSLNWSPVSDCVTSALSAGSCSAAQHTAWTHPVCVSPIWYRKRTWTCKSSASPTKISSSDMAPSGAVSRWVVAPCSREAENHRKNLVLSCPVGGDGLQDHAPRPETCIEARIAVGWR
jgi:hypothetical protein